MNADDFEKQLQRRVQTPLPGEWRAEILKAAYAERAEVIAKAPTHRARFTASQFRWGALVAVWAVIAGFHFAEPSSEPVTLAIAPRNSNWEVLWQEQQLLIAELLDAKPVAPQAPPPAPEPRRRSGDRKRTTHRPNFV